MRHSLPRATSSVTLLAALLVTFALSPLAAQPAGGFPSELARELSDRLDQLQMQYEVVGVAASIVSARHGVWVDAAGHANPNTGDTIAREMLLNIGSVTKTFTSALVLQLVDEGAIGLDDSIGEWLPAHTNVNGAITVRQLLGHTGGVANYSDHPQFWPWITMRLDRFVDPEEVFQFVGPADFAPGADWNYSNTGYLLLGKLIERITGRSYEEELARRIVAPHALASIAMGNTDSLPGEVVTSWGDPDDDGDLDPLDAPPLRAHFSSTWTSGGLFSSIEDLARWGDLLYRGRVLSPAMMTAMTTFRSVSGFGPNSGYGLGVIRATLAGRVGMGHGGSMPGFHTFLWHIPGDSVTVAIIVNQDSPAPQAIAMQILNEYLLRAPGFSSAPATRTTAASMLAPRPNPFTDATSIELSAGRSGDGSVRVFSLLGEPVRTLVDGAITEGAHTLVWDGRNDAGDELPAGTYLVRLRTREETITRRVVKR